ncbi:MAG: GAF and ANTAR domain-containing protein [Lapillicoccus sp.]
MTQQRLLEVFVALADTMVAEFDVIDLMHTLTETTVELLDADAAGLMLADQRGHLQVITATSHQIQELEALELLHGEGPCVDCFRTGEAVTNVPIAEAGQRWPRFQPAAERAGYSTVHALPMRLRDQVIGSMNVYRVKPGRLSETDIALGRGLADMATIGLLQERAVSERAVLAEQLQGALNSRIVIEQAKGVLAERLNLDPDASFAVMRRFARGSGRPLLTVASHVINGTLTLRP